MNKIALVVWYRNCKGHFGFNWRAVFSYRWYQSHMTKKGLYF